MNKTLIFTKPYPPYITKGKRYNIIEKTSFGNFRFMSDIGTIEGVGAYNVTGACEWGYICNDIKLSNNIKIL